MIHYEKIAVTAAGDYRKLPVFPVVAVFPWRPKCLCWLKLRRDQRDPYPSMQTENDPMAERFILIPGRTSKQGCGISEGKYGENYQSEINTLQVALDDMRRLQLTDGDKVRLTSEWGQVEVAVKPAPKDELPSGLLFIAYGDLSSQLMGGDTHGSGMPTSKGFDVELEVI